MPTFITLTVPPDTQPGQAVQFEDPNTKQVLQVAIPPGAAPGTAFQVQIASNTESSAAEIESALKAAQSTAVAAKAVLVAGAKVSIVLGKATYAGAKYAHAHGWDKKAASMTVSLAKGAAGLTKAAMNSKAANFALTAAVSGSTSSTAANSVPIPGLQQAAGPSSGGVMYVLTPPDAAPGQQIMVISPSGQSLIVAVPDGAVPGSQFVVQL